MILHAISEETDQTWWMSRRKKILNIGSGVRGWVEPGVGGGGGAGKGKQDYCGATGRPQVTFKIIRGAPCCLPTLPTPVQAAFSLCRAHRLLCWFCHALAHLYLIRIPLMTHPLTREMTIGCVSSRTHKVYFA